MKKTIFLTIAAIVLLACSDQNAPSNPHAKNGALPGEFSVSENRKVHFAQGNLQYILDTRTWQFAANQYDVIGVDNFDHIGSSSGAIDAFAWGTGDYPTFHEAMSAVAYVDWGVNSITNGGNKPNMWRTLTTEEWGYILWERPNAEVLFGHGNVAGMNGLIILPDNWTTPQGIAFAPSTTNGLPKHSSAYQKSYYDDKERDHFSDNEYTKETWAKMEKAGAVFLPAAGILMYDVAPNVPYVISEESGVEGLYWSASPRESFEEPEKYACAIDFRKNSLHPYSYDARWNHGSVRLVQ